MTPLEKFASAVRIAGFGTVASEYIKLSGEDAPEVWDLRSTLEHLGTKLANQAQEEAVVHTGLGALRNVCPGVKTAFNVDFTPEFHAVNSLARSNMKLASHGLEAPLAERRLALWNNMKAAAEVMPDPVAHLAKVAIQVWSETERSGEKTASSREEREAFAVSFAANYLVDQKIAQLNVPATVKAKLASLSAEAAMYDLNKVVRATGCDEQGRIKNAGFMDWLHGKQNAPASPSPRLQLDINKIKAHLPELKHQHLPFEDAIYFNHGGNESFYSTGGMEDELNRMGEAAYYPHIAAYIRSNTDPTDPDSLEGFKHDFGYDPAKVASEKHAFDPYDPRVIGAAIGAVGGAGIGAYDDKDNRLRGGVMGALMGAPLGAVGGHVYHEYDAHFAQQAKAKADAALEATRNAQTAFMRLLEAARMHGKAIGGTPGNYPLLNELLTKRDVIMKHFQDGNKTLPLEVLHNITPDDMQGLQQALSRLNTRVA